MRWWCCPFSGNSVTWCCLCFLGQSSYLTPHVIFTHLFVINLSTNITQIVFPGPTFSFSLSWSCSLHIDYRICILSNIHAFFYKHSFYKSIIRLKSVENKHNLSITKAQIFPQDELKNWENQAWACKTLVVINGIPEHYVRSKMAARRQ